MPDAPAYENILDAAELLRGHAVRTPLLRSEALDAATGGRILIKPEVLQRTGSFKFRGAYNRLSRLSADERERGVVAFSSGNHAQGVALAARMLGMKAVIVMPSDAPKVKADGVRRLGADLVVYDRATEDREEISARLVGESGAILVPSYDDPFIIAGQGTVGLEIAEDAAAAGEQLDALVCCAGGGGLIAGIGLAVKRLSPETEIWAAEPEGFDDHRRSLEAGRIVSNERRSGSIQDAIITPSPGRLTFPINRKQLAGAVAVSDGEALDAMAFAFSHLKLVVEPGGAAALAALLNGRIDVRGRTAAVVLTGGNVDAEMFAQALARPPANAPDRA